jgi:NitT/TauT family transport system substrate-binding protein
MPLARLAAVAALAAAGPASSQEAVVFGTNWVAQAEHGGFYQALADGTYAACGLEVEILPGGPQVNNRALLMAGRVDFYMGGNMLAAFNAVAQGIPSVVVAALIQKDPQAILSHPGEADSWEELRDLTLLIGDGGFVTFYQWMMAAWGFSAEQRAVYTFNPAPFLADPRTGMQGYLTSEPFTVAKEGGFVPNVFLLADHGYRDYSTTIEVMAETIATRPEAVACFVDGSILGWYGYLYGDRSAADALILAHNPDMSQDRIDYSVARMKEAGIVDSGDALTLGIGAMTEERVGAFYRDMVAAGAVAEGIDWRRAFDTRFVNKGLGMELRPAD